MEQVTGVIVSFTVPPERVASLRALYEALSAKVAAHEEGSIAYALRSVQGVENRYKLVELYRDNAAYMAHANAPYVQERLPELIAFFGPDTTVEFLEG